jgi:hypothetical protein
MTSRRELLQIGFAGVALQAVSSLAWPQTASAADITPDRVIFDHRFPSSVSFADSFARRGIAVHGIRGDITALWYDTLYFDWRERKAPLAGLTTAESLFCLEILARDAGMRVTERHVRADGLVSWSIGRRVV